MEKISDIFTQLEGLPLNLREEVLLRALEGQIKAGALVLWRLSEITDRLEAKEQHLTRLINRIEQLGWETAIRNEMERRERNRECRTSKKKQLRRFS